MLKFRRGNCPDCGAMYKLPHDFPADKARCQECSGVVVVGPPETRGGSSAKAAPARPAKVPTRASSVPAKSGAKKGTQGVGAKPPTARSSSRTPAKGGAGKSAPAKGGARKGSSRSSSRNSGESRRGRKQEKKKNWPAMIGALFGLVAVAGGGWWFLNQEDTGLQANEGDAEVANAEAGEAAAQADADMAKPEMTKPDMVAGDATGGETGGEEGMQKPDMTAAGQEGGEAATDADGVDDKKTADAEPKKETKKKLKDPSVVDLTVWEDFPPAPGTTDEEWTELTGWVAQFSDPLVPARKLSKAKTGLLEASRKSMPAIINAFRKIDVSTTEGRRMGDQFQRELLQKICNGTNYDWRYDEEPASQYFNKRVIELWCKSWDQAKESDMAWSNLSKIPLEKIQSEAGDEASAVVDDLDDF